MSASMNDDLHARARRLIAMEQVEGLAADDRTWLNDHLAACQACAAHAEAADAALRTLRTTSVSLPRGLAESTQWIVRRKAEELRAERARRVALAIGCTVSWILGVASAPLVWRICAWGGAMFDLPRAVWLAGFVAWWFVPVAAMSLVILWQRRRAEGESREVGAEWRRR
jgi:hypothetical protein